MKQRERLLEHLKTGDRKVELMSDWHPIKSAPKTGENILISDGVEVDMAYWDYDDWCAPHSCSNSIPYDPDRWQPKPDIASINPVNIWSPEK